MNNLRIEVEGFTCAGTYLLNNKGVVSRVQEKTAASVNKEEKTAIVDTLILTIDTENEKPGFLRIVESLDIYEGKKDEILRMLDDIYENEADAASFHVWDIHNQIAGYSEDEYIRVIHAPSKKTSSFFETNKDLKIAVNTVVDRLFGKMPDCTEAVGF